LALVLHSLLKGFFNHGLKNSNAYGKLKLSWISNILLLRNPVFSIGYLACETENTSSCQLPEGLGWQLQIY